MTATHHFAQPRPHGCESRVQLGFSPTHTPLLSHAVWFPNNISERREITCPTKRESLGPIKGASQGLKPSLWAAVELNGGIRKPPVLSSSLGFQGSDSFFCCNPSSLTSHCPLHIERVTWPC